MLWFYLALLSVFGIAISNIFRRLIMKDNNSDAIVSSIVFQVLGAAIVAIFAFVHGFILPPIKQYPINFLAQAICWGLATLFLFKASNYLEASETAIITTATSIVTILTAVIFLKDNFGLLYSIGTLLIIIAVIYSSYQKKKIEFNKGVLFALAYCIFAGIASTNDAFLIHKSDTLSILTIGFLTPGLFLMLIKPTALKEVKYIFNSTNFWRIFLLTLSYALSSIAYFFAIGVGGQVSQVFTINESSIILTLLTSAIFLNEKDHIYKKIFCTILVTIGIIFLS